MLFRDKVKELYGDVELASVVGCGIDRLSEEKKEKVSEHEIRAMVEHYRTNREFFDEFETINAKREHIKCYYEKNYCY